MKKLLICLLAMACMLLGCAQAQQITMLEGEYTDVPSVPTQDAVVTFKADQDCEVTVLLPDEKSIALLEDIYTFVWREGNRPARYYDEETQKKIAELSGVDIDVLHMTEFMGLELAGHPQEPVKMNVLLDVDYEPGQLIVVVMGIEKEDGEYRWFPYRGEVPETGRILYDVPAEEYKAMTGPQVTFHVLTVREGARGGILSEEVIERERIVTPSKGARDLIKIRRWYSTTGEVIEDDFSIFLVDRTEEMEKEIARIAEHIGSGGAPITWFPEEMQRQTQLLHPVDLVVTDMVIYDIVAVMAENYKDTYGDVATENLFAAAYSPDSRMAAMLGFPIEGATEAPYFDWYCLRAEALEENGHVELVFKQLVIPTMEEEPAMLVVFSEPIAEEDNAK
ncbi:MAG: hypothetical protein J6M47_06435 [Clostridia bacterium]|nr:hypothetical protein [Clostridia bacterium]